MFPNTSILPHALPWLPSFEVGDDRLDGEHRALLETANDLCALAAILPPPPILRRAGRELIAVVEAHFESEEALFPIIGYGERQSHVREHLTLLNALNALLLDAHAPAPPVATATTRMLLLEHILRHDLGFKSWIQASRGH